MKYLSLFSGIGGFEVAIHKIFPDAECIGYSEIDGSAIKVYEHHFPDHKNLGDVTKITDEQIRTLMKQDGCDLIVGGFPCKNLTSIALLNKFGDSDGLEGKQSKLFYELVRIISIILEENPRVNFIIENNSSMKKTNKQIITQTLDNLFEGNIFVTPIDSSLFGVQKRRRLFWTNFNIPLQGIQEQQTWDCVLEPVKDVKDWIISDKYIKSFNKVYEHKQNIVTKICIPSGDYYTFQILPKDNHRSRWDMGFVSDTMTEQLYTPYPVGKSKTVLSITGSSNIIIDRRFGEESCFVPRKFTSLEKERLFGFEDGYTKILKTKTQRTKVLGNSVVIFVVEHVVSELLLYLCE